MFHLDGPPVQTSQPETSPPKQDLLPGLSEEDFLVQHLGGQPGAVRPRGAGPSCGPRRQRELSEVGGGGLPCPAGRDLMAQDGASGRLSSGSS